jgi:hypothetical protein
MAVNIAEKLETMAKDFRAVVAGCEELAEAERRFDPQLDGKSVTYDEMVQEHADQERTMGQSHWWSLKLDKSRLNEVLQMHSHEVSCGLVQFKLMKPDKGAEELVELKAKAESAQAADRMKADKAVEEIDEQAASSKSEDFNALSSSLKNVKSDAVAGLEKVSSNLEETTSMSMGLNELLTKAYPDTNVNVLQKDAKAEMVKKLQDKRKLERVQEAMDASSKLHKDEWTDPVMKNILGKKACIASLKDSAVQASNTQDNARIVNENIKSMLDKLKEQLALGRSQKVEANAELAQINKEEKAFLEEIEAFVTKKKDAYIKNEALRDAISDLEACIEEVEAFMAAAEDASTGTVAACEQWQVSAQSSAQRVHEYVENRMVECRTAMAPLAQAAAFNYEFAKILSAKAGRDIDAETKFLEQEINDNEVLQEIKRKQMVEAQSSDNVETSMSDILLANGELRDAKIELESALQNYTTAKQALQKVCQTSEEASARLQNFLTDGYGAEQTQKEAEELADMHYKSVKLRQKAKGSVTFASDGAAAANAGVLALNDPSVKRYLQEMKQEMDQKWAQKFDQLKAEMMFSMSMSAAPSEAGASEAGDFEVVPKTGAATHSSGSTKEE